MSERNSAAFIIRLWLESREIKGAKPIWRGSIEQAETGERQYLTSLAGIVPIIARQLELMGVAPGDVTNPSRLQRFRRRFLRRTKPA